MMKKWLGVLSSVAVLIGGLTMTTAQPAAAAASVTLDKSAPGSVLLGDPVPYTLTASNPAGNDPLYNVSFSDVLPAGFEYVGPTTPASAGEPTVTQTSSGQTLLVWNNVTDLQAASSFALKFEAQLKTPVPTTIVPVDTNTAYVSGSTNERLLPKFTTNGVPIADPEVVSDTATADTKRAPFVVEKKNTNSPEGELLRGVHDQPSTYTLTIRNNKHVPTNNVTLTDYLPAQLEFLGCGNQDNSAGPEYPGSGPLGDPAVNPDPCPNPVSVETVDSPQDVPGLGDLTGVYTAVTWNVGNLAANEVQEIKYVAGIPLNANTMTWNPGPAPSAGSLEQGSNLDNNNGASTRELGEQSITNEVSAQGAFQGTAPSNPVTVTEKHTVTIEDVRMQKSVSPSDFTPGGIATFTMDIQASEYMDASNIVVTDTLPNGYCPLGATGTTSWAAEPLCTAQAADPKPTPGFASVPTWDNGSKTYNVVFQPLASIIANGSATVTLPARMLPNYRDGDALGARTVAGDGFTNTVELTAKTNAIKDSDDNPVEPGEETVGDTSQAEQGTPLPTISKEIKTRAAPPDFPGGMKCDPTVAPPYVSDPDLLPAFRKGDVICFKLRVDFPKTIDTKNAVVTDFPPVGTEFVVLDEPETGNNTFAVTGNNNVTVTPALTATKFVLTLGDGGFVPKNGVFEATFAVRVLEPGTGTKPEITGNLMKMRTENTAGVAQSYRDQAEYDLLPPPNLSIDKGVIATDKPSATYPAVSPLQDNKPIEQGGTATFQINIENQPQTPGSDYSVRGVQVWDRLPEQLTCSAVNLAALAYIKPGSSTELPLPAGIATCDDASGGSILKWVFPTPDLADAYSIDVDQTLSLIYTMKVPDEAAAGTNYANTAGVRQFEAFTDIPGITATYIPAENIDPTQDPKADSPPLKDPSNVFIPGAEVAKDAETSLTETNNNFKTQATIGETITYTYEVTVQKGTTVYRGVLSDALPTGIDFVSLVKAELVGSSTPLPDLGFTIDATNGTLTFPVKWINDTSGDQTFRVTVTAKVGQAAATCGQATCTLPTQTVANNVKRTNTAKFESFTAESGGTKTETTTPYDMFVMQPSPSITKTANPTSVTSTATDITYTLRASSSGTRPPLHDVTIVDCVPDTLTVKTVNNGGTLGTNPNCDTSDKVSITWTFDPLVPGTPKDVTYVANIKPGSPADVKFKNTVGMSGTSMPGDVTGERTYLTGANAEVFITGASIDKTVTPAVATIGETATYTIDTKLPDAAYQNLVVLDTLPQYIDYADVSDIALTCFTTDSSYQNPAACSTGVTATLLGPDPGSPGATGQQIGWSFDALPNQDKHRIIRISYKSRVSDLPQNVAGATRTNSASAGYGYATKPETLAAAQNPPKTIGSDGATITLTEPNLKIAKMVNGEDAITALPDDTFGYTINVTNPQRTGGVPTSTAYAVKVRDCVPDGVAVVNPGTGTVGTDNTCTTTDKVSVSWPTITSLAVGDSQQYTYTAKLKGNTTTAQTNVVSALEWTSLTPDPNNPDIRTYGPITADAVVTPVLPDVKIEKFNSDAVAYIAQPYTWSIEVTNPSTRDPGPTAYQVKVDDVLPPNWTYKAGTTVITFDGNQVSTDDPTVDSSNPLAVKLAWDTKTDLPVNKKIVITFQATPGADVVDDPGVGIDVTPKVPHINTANTTWNPGEPTDGWTPVTSGNVTAQTGIASADLELTKSHVTYYTPALQDEDNVIPGTQFKWKLQVKNNGPDNAVGPYVVVDTLPAGNTYVGSQGTDWTCEQDQVDAQKITCTHPNAGTDGLAKDASLPDLLLTVSVDIDAPPTMENTATVTGQTYDPNPANNTGKDTVTPLPPSVQIEKFNSDDVAYIDQPYTWRLEITNPSENVPGPTAYQVSASDVLPPNWTYQAGSTVITLDGTEISTDDPTVDSSNPLAVKLAWDTKTDLPVNKKIVITFQATPGADVVDDPGVGIDVTPKVPHINTANTSWYPGTPTTEWQLQTSGNVTAQTAIGLADLQIVKLHRTDYPKSWNVADNEVVPGTEFEWVLQVSNNGPDPSVGQFTVVDTLPDGVEYRGYNDGAGWSCNAVGQFVTCTNPGPVDGIAKGASLEDLVLTVYVDEAATANQRNTATVTGKTLDPNPVNNTATDEVTLRPLADLAIEKSRTQPYVVGNQVTYTLAVTNLGPSVSVKDITVVDTLPTGLSIASIDAGPWECQPTSGETDTLTCVLKQDLAPNEQAPLINVTVDVLESPGDEAVNTAEVTGTTPDPNPDNNTDTVTDPVVSDVQLEIAKKTTGANPVTAGTATEFTITVSNLGPAKAKNVVVVDQLEAGLRATSATGTGWTCDVGSGTTVTCTRANFPLSASPSDIVIKADVDKAVPGGTTLKNVATVTTTSPQPGGNPPPATSTVDVVAKSDLAISKTHDGGPWKIGGTGTWNVRVVNNGPSDNPGPITVIDTLPNGNEFLSAAGDGWTCTASGRTVTCVYAAGLVVGQSAEFSIRVNVVTGAAPSVVNPAEVTSPIPDTDPSNNTATDEVRVLRSAQTANKLPPNPKVLPASTTEQGQKIRTKVRCRPLKSSAAGEASFCNVRKNKEGTVRVTVFGTRPVLVIVTQFAKGTKDYRPFKRVKKYRVRP